MDKMKAAVFHGIRDVRIEERPVPEIGDDDVLLRSRMVSICGSDLQPYVEGVGGVEGEVFGHEYVAEIAKIGKNVSGHYIGERVFGHNVSVCGKCWYCQHGDYAHCSNVLHFYTGKHLAHPGGFSQYMLFSGPLAEPSPEAPHMNALMHIPDALSDEQAALLEPFGVGIAAMEKCGVRAGDTVVILGAGMTGNCAMQWAKKLGATVLVVDISEHRLDVAKQCGADYVINNADDDCYEQVAKLIGEPGWIKGSDATVARVVADCAGYPGSLNTALKIVRSGGTVCEIADSSVLSPVNITYISYKDLLITNSSGCDIAKALDGMLDGSLKTAPLIDEIVPLEMAKYAFECQANHKAMKVLVKMKA